MKICFIFCNFCLRLGEPRTSNKQLFGQHFFKEPKLSAASSHDRRSYLIAIAHNSIERTKNNLDSSSVASDPVTFVSSPLPRAQWPGRQRRRSRIRVLFLLSRSFIGWWHRAANESNMLSQRIYCYFFSDDVVLFVYYYRSFLDLDTSCF